MIVIRYSYNTQLNLLKIIYFSIIRKIIKCCLCRTGLFIFGDGCYEYWSPIFDGYLRNVPSKREVGILITHIPNMMYRMTLQNENIW